MNMEFIIKEKIKRPIFLNLSKLFFILTKK